MKFRKITLFYLLLLISVGGSLSFILTGLQIFNPYIEKIYGEGNYFYVIENPSQVKIFDIKDPTNPIEVGLYSQDNGDFISNVYISGNYLYVIAKNNRMEIIDISDLNNIFKVGEYSSNSNEIRSIYVENNYAYIMTEQFEIIDISNPTNPNLVGNYSHDNFDKPHIKIIGNWAILTNLQYIRILNIENPSNITKINEVEFNGTSWESTDINYYGNFIYISSYFENEGLWEIQIFDINDLANSSIVRQFYDGNIENSSEGNIDGEYMFLKRRFDYNIIIIEISDPINPTKVGEYYDWFFYDIYIKENHIYAVAGRDDIKIIDISDPSTPKEVFTHQKQFIIGAYVAFAIIGVFSLFGIGNFYISRNRRKNEIFKFLQNRQSTTVLFDDLAKSYNVSLIYLEKIIKKQIATGELDGILDIPNQKLFIRQNVFDEEIHEKTAAIKKLLEISDEVSISDIENMFNLSRPEILNLILKIQESIPGLLIKNNKVIVEKEDLSSFISTLDGYFADWSNKEATKLGKKEK